MQLGCFRQKDDRQQEEYSQQVELVKSGVKVPINPESGQLSYFSSAGRQPFLESIDSFLNWYTEEELESVTRLVISNRNPANGEIRPLITTKGIERLPNLRQLIISTSGIERLEGHENLKHLEGVDFLLNEIRSISGINHLDNFVELFLVENPIESLHDIEASEHLLYLNLDRSLLSSIDGIERFPNLISFSADLTPYMAAEARARSQLKKTQEAETSDEDIAGDEENATVMETSP